MTYILKYNVGTAVNLHLIWMKIFICLQVYIYVVIKLSLISLSLCLKIGVDSDSTMHIIGIVCCTKFFIFLLKF